MHLSTEEIVDLTNLNPPQTDEDKEANGTLKEGKISKGSTKDAAKSSKKSSTKTNTFPLPGDPDCVLQIRLVAPPFGRGNMPGIHLVRFGATHLDT